MVLHMNVKAPLRLCLLLFVSILHSWGRRLMDAINLAEQK